LKISGKTTPHQPVLLSMQ